MSQSETLSALGAAIDQYCKEDGLHETPIPGLRCIRISNPVAFLASLYQPCICIAAQGAKDVILDEEVYHYRPNRYLAISVDLPAVGHITEATPEQPYLCLQMDIDSNVVHELVAQVGAGDPASPNEVLRGISVGQATEPFLESALRLIRLLGTPADIPALAPMALREMHYRLLTGDNSRHILQLTAPSGATEGVMRVLRNLRADYAKPARIEDLAETAGMSESSFHHHFKQVTAMSPIQYQKRLRLLEARRILLSEQSDASSTAYRVGYQSPSQFNREYARMFGAPPIRDIEALRQTAVQNLDARATL